jgi:uncharacterized protein YukE
MREPDPQQDWLTSSDNHASADYERKRLGETYTETHPPGERARRQADNGRRKRIRNRAASRFGKINWEAYPHRHLYDMIMRADPGTMYARAGDWSQLAGRIEGTTSRVQQVVERVMASWQGQAAVDAAAANTRLMQWASTASHTAGRIAEGLANYTEAVEVAQHRMPPPAFTNAERNFRDGYSVTMSGGPSDAVFLRELLTDGMVSAEQSRARKAEAVAVMEGYESNSRQVHDTMPEFTDARTGIDPGPSWTPGPTGDDSVPPSGGGAGPSGGTPGGTKGGLAGATPGGSTSAAGLADPSLLGGGSGQGGTGYGGGPGSLNAGVGGLGGAQGGADAVRGGPGAGGIAGRGMPGAAGGFAGSGGRGAPGAFGGMPFGAGANGEEDAEHTNKYDEGLDLFDDLPPAYPPVFGA